MRNTAVPNRPPLSVPLCLVALVLTCSAWAQDYRTINDGNWSTTGIWERYDGSNWLPAPGPPTSADGAIWVFDAVTVNSNHTVDDVTIDPSGSLALNGGTFTVADGVGDDLESFGTLTLAGGILTTNGTVVVGSGNFSWTSGTLNGTGTASIQSPGTASFSSGTKTLLTTLTNHSTATWSGGSISGAGTLANATSGTLNITFADGFSHNVAIQNAGNLNYTGSGTWNTVGGAPTMVNSGALNVNAGSWQFNSALTNTGTIHLPAGRLMVMNSTVSLDPGTAITGTGEFRVSGGTTTLNTPLTNSTNYFWLYQGTFNTTAGNAVNLQAGSSMLWNTTALGGAGGFNIGSGVPMQIAGISTHPLNTTLTNSGTITWSGGDMSGSGSLMNQSGGVTDITFSSLSGLQVPFSNSGTVNYTGTSSFYTAAPSTLTNAATGVFNVNNGVWQFNTTMVNAGTLHIAATKVMIMNATVSLNAGTAITGTGEFRVSGGTTTLNTPLTNSTNYFWLYQGAFNTTVGNAMSLQAGSSMLWNTTALGGAGGFSIGSGVPMQIAGISTHPLNTTLTNSGTITWSGGDMSGSGSLMNQSGGVTDITFSSLSGLQVPFSNSGTVNYTGTSSFYTAAPSTFTNAATGVFNVNNGVWQFNTTMVNAGTLHIAATKVMIMNATVSLNAGTAITGPGEFRVSGGTTTLNTPLTNSTNYFWLYQGAFNTTAGNAMSLQAGSSMLWNTTALGGAGGFSIGSGVPMQVGGTSAHPLNTSLDNSGTITWSGGALGGSGTVNNAAAGTLDITFAGVSSQGVFLNNAGVLNYTGAGWNTVSAPAMTNSGTWNITGGNWVMASALTNTGTIQVAATRTLTFSISSIIGGMVDNSGTVAGTITSFTGTTFTNNGSVVLANLPFAGAAAQALNGTGSIATLQINNANGVTLGGTQTVTGTLMLTSGSVTLGANDLILSNATLGGLVGGTAANHFITNGTGSFHRQVSGPNYPFPIGTGTSYLPVTLSLTSGPAERFATRVQNNVHSDYGAPGVPAGQVIANDQVERTWVITENTPGGNTATVQVQWSAGDEGAGFDRTNCGIFRYDGAAWLNSAFGGASGTGPYTRSLAGLTSFREFTVADPQSILPIACPIGPPIGSACDDGDACTTGDTVDPNCDCVGTPSPDSDEDGICDVEDDCPFLQDDITNIEPLECTCALGYYATIEDIAGNDVITDCTICPPGSYCPNGIDQFPCPAGYFSAAVGQIACTACEAGTYSDVTGSTSCTACAAGYYNPITAATSCLACEAGSYSDVTGSIECQSCAAGYFNGLEAQTSCTACPPGSYSDVTGSTACQSCAAGYFNGLEAQTSCTACPAGSYSDQTGSIECQSCAAGYYNGLEAQTSCTACPAGSYSDQTGSIACSSCAAGYFNPSTAATSCTACPAGSYSDQTGSIACASCAAGYYNPSTAATSCQACPAGSYSGVTGSIACQSCAAGYANNVTAATSCVACPPGSYSAVAGSINCLLCAANTYNPSNAATSCLACPIGETSGVGATECTPTVLPCTQNLTIEFQTDGSPWEISWEIREQGTNNLVQNGPAGSIVPPNGIQTVSTCVPNGCFYLRVIDSGGDGITNGGYILRTAGPGGIRLIDNRRNFGNLAGGPPDVSQMAGTEGWCNPMGTTTSAIYTSCDKLDWTTGQYVVCSPVPAVAALWDAGNTPAEAITGYEFQIFNPNGGYIYNRFRAHNVSDGFAPDNASRACHMKINNWAVANHVPANVLMNVRIRTRINGVNGNWGPACRFKIDPVAAACPLTNLMDIPGDPNLSCNSTRMWGTGNYIHARPVSGATQYQWRFRLDGESFITIRTTTTYFIQLNWATLPLQNGKTYQVDVRAYKGGAWCVDAAVPANCGFVTPCWVEWNPSKPCLLTIDNTPLDGGNENSLGAGQSERSEGLRMYPNPNRGDQLYLGLDAVEEGVTTVSVDITDMFGKRVSARTIAVTDGIINTVLDLDGDMANGMYLVHITAGEQRFTERLVVQR